MKKILSILVASLLFLGAPCQAVVMVGFGQSTAAPPTCGTLTFSGTPGDAETFENAEGAFCTGSTFSETDVGSNISTFNTSQYHGGAHSLSIAATGTAPDNRITADLGANEDSYKMTFWFYVPASNAWDNQTIFTTTSGAQVLTDHPILLRNQGNNFRLNFYDSYGKTSDGTDVAYPDAAWYKITLNITRAGTSTLSLYNASSILLDTLSVTSPDNPARYIIFTSGTNAGGTIYFDDIQYDSTNP